MDTIAKKPWIKPELRMLEPTRELLSLFGRDAVPKVASPNEQNVVTGQPS